LTVPIGATFPYKQTIINEIKEEENRIKAEENQTEEEENQIKEVEN